MWYGKNIGGKEQLGRLIAGGLMILCGIFGLKASMLGLLPSGAGAVTAFTGLFGYCPACLAAGRKPLAKP